MATFPEWDRVILEHPYDAVDSLSVPSYYEPDDDMNGLMASYTPARP